jgi:Kazal-type serine protease inhibitor domain
MKLHAPSVALGIAISLAPACHGERKQPPPMPATCSSAGSCAPAQYCDFQPGLCGAGKIPGTCRPRPENCSAAYAPVCGCDHRVYDSECAAQAAGVDLDVNGGCKALLPNFAACGSHFCDTRQSYCEIVLSDVTELPSDYSCKPLPASCAVVNGAAPDCSCFPAGTRCLSFCGPLQTGGGVKGLHLTCRL